MYEEFLSKVSILGKSMHVRPFHANQKNIWLLSQWGKDTISSNSQVKCPCTVVTGVDGEISSHRATPDNSLLSVHNMEGDTAKAKKRQTLVQNVEKKKSHTKKNPDCFSVKLVSDDVRVGNIQT